MPSSSEEGTRPSIRAEPIAKAGDLRVAAHEDEGVGGRV